MTAIQAVWLAGASITVLAPQRIGHLDRVVRDAQLDLILLGPQEAPRLPTRVVPLLDVHSDTAVPAVPAPVAPPDLAVLQYTSGSTQSPRGVAVTHAHLAANLAAIRSGTSHDAMHPARMLSWLPLHHDMGLIGFLSLAMSCGCSLWLRPPSAFARRPGIWLRDLSEHRITISGGPNFAFGLMTRLLAAEQELDLGSVRLLLSGGEPIDVGLMSRFAGLAGAYGLDPGALMAGYGMAESTLAVAFSALGAGIQVDRSLGRELARLGRPVPGTQLRINSHDLVGEIEICGPSVVSNGWLRTGDLGYLSPDGELVVCGRAKDVIFAAGRNIYPSDVEAAVQQVAGVRPGGVAAFGVPGEKLIIAVESRGPKSDGIQREVFAAATAETSLAPAAVVIVPPGWLPKTSSGKLRRGELRRRYLEGQLP